MAEFGLSFATPEEYKFRLNLFAQKEAENTRINSNPSNTFTVGHNKFSTWTNMEYKKLLGYRGNQPSVREAALEVSDLPATVDWRQDGAVNPVKNQAMCGSCWAFSAIAAIEGHHFIQTGTLETFSEQELVDCDEKCFGCGGGLQSSAFDYLKTHFIQRSVDYPYIGKLGICNYNYSKKTTFEVQGYQKVPSFSVA